MLSLFIKARRIRRRHTHSVTDSGMLCSFIHWPKNVVKNLFGAGWHFIKDEILGTRMGALAWVQWWLVLSPFALYGWDGGWSHLWHHNAPVIFMLFITALFTRSTTKRTSVGWDDD